MSQFQYRCHSSPSQAARLPSQEIWISTVRHSRSQATWSFPDSASEWTFPTWNNCVRELLTCVVAVWWQARPACSSSPRSRRSRSSGRSRRRSASPSPCPPRRSETVGNPRPHTLQHFTSGHRPMWFEKREGWLVGTAAPHARSYGTCGLSRSSLTPCVPVPHLEHQIVQV